MTFLPRLAGLVLAALSLLAPCRAESIASSASSAGSASVGSVSDSISASSDSSTRRTEVADGDYRVLEVAQRPERPGKLRLKLQAADRTGPDAEFWLEVPQQALARRAVVAGDLVHARQRAYGYEFAHADTREPFFLALADTWRRELDARPVAF